MNDIENDTSGLSSHRGFIYQDYVFLMVMLQNIDPGMKIGYEYVDDVFVENSQPNLCFQHNCTAVQCKSSKPSLLTVGNVFINWLLTKNVDQFVLYTESSDIRLDLETLYTETKRIVVDYILNHDPYTKVKPSSKSKIYSLITRYGLTCSNIDSSGLKGDLNKVLADAEVISSPLSEVEDKVRELYFSRECINLCKEQAKESRLETFENNFFALLRRKIKEKAPLIVGYADYKNIADEINKSITDDAYCVDYTVFSDIHKDEVKQLIDSSSLGRFLSKVSVREERIIDYLINEMYYEELREYYLSLASRKVDGVEKDAYDIYLDKSSVTSFDTGFQMELREMSSLLKNNNAGILRNDQYSCGCFMYLSSEGYEGDWYIDWCGKNVR